MRLKIYHSRRNTCFPQDRNGTKGSPHACIITVIQKQYLLSVTLQQTCMSGSKCRSQRCHRIGKPCLMHGYHIHISFTQDQIIFSRGSCNIQPVQIPAFIKDRSLRRVQVLRLSVTHHSASKPITRLLTSMIGKITLFQNLSYIPLRSSTLNRPESRSSSSL